MAKAQSVTKSNTFFVAVLIVEILVAVVISAFAYNYFPATMITHWGINGEPNGFSTKEFGLFFVPVLMIGLAVLLYYIPRIDPLKKNILLFKKEYNFLIAILLGFLLYVHMISILINAGLSTNIIQLLAPALGVLFFSLGTIMPNIKRNYFIGIRTPWALASDENWKKTHLLGAKLFKATGVLSFLGIFFPSYALVLLIAPLLASVVIVFVYSFLEFKKSKLKKK